jgi:gamma-glutamylcyclotransferase (GGCT)/AIG2-like uncharacterized protein YtfP
MPDNTMTERVAVYGTLKQGLANFSLLNDASFLGTDSLNKISLYDLGPYPGAKAESSAGIEVEVYEVDALQMQQLDELEECIADAPELGLYHRRQFMTRFGLAWVYLYNPSVEGLKVQRCGSWRPVQEVHIKNAEI